MKQMADNKNFQTGKVTTLALAHMLHDTYSCFLAPILPLLMEKLSLTFTEAGLLSVIGRLTSLLNPLIGIFADKIRLRYLVIIAPAVTSVCMSLLGVAPNYGILALLLCGMGLGSTFFHVPTPVMIKRLSGTQLGKGMSIYMFGGEAGRSLGPLLILGAVSLWGLEGTWRLIFFGIGFSLLLYIDLHRMDISRDFQKKKKEKDVWHTLKTHLSLFALIGGFIFFRAFLRSSMTTFLPTYLKLKGASLWFGGVSLSIFQFSGALATFFAGPLSDRIGRRRTMLISAVSAPVLMIAFTSVDGIARLPILILLSFSLFAQGPVLLALVHDINHERPAFINGIYMTMNFFLTALAALMVGVSGDIIGLERTYHLTPLVACIAVLPAYFVRKDSSHKK